MTARDEFLATRRMGVGGSDIAAILGLSRYRTALEVYLEKRGELAQQQESTERMYWGTQLEDLIAREYAQRNQTRVWNRPMFRHAKYAFATASIDRAVHTISWQAWDKLESGRTGLECKTADKANALEWGEATSDEIPVEYLLQCQWYLFVCEAERWDVALLLGGNDYREYRIVRDDELIADLIEAAGTFWEGVQSATTPRPKTLNDLKLLYQRDNGRIIEADSAIATTVSDLRETRTQMETLEKTEQRQEMMIKQYLGEASHLRYQNQTLATWRTAKPSRVFDKPAFEKAHPEMIERFTIEKPGSRRFLLKGDKHA